MKANEFFKRLVLYLLLGLAYTIFPVQLQAKEPRYEGRTFSEWKQDLVK